MSLNASKAAAKVKVKNILEDMMTKDQNSTEEFANRLIDVLEDWLKEASIIYISGLVAGSNQVTGTFNGKLE
ncbi:hypothetical protein EGI16_21505 [Chryseobacterium sp. G0240]|uniref:hypothetical protein n=1 Tax=Chryseobacterium sp. G0240 TaxID=2487066 RepID=UPI000F446BAB|nr:hypothetical protein [Chryseobacterium sp. G0240]ROH98414.1 hypothetical protein EGI16_21505 [Chryseobacterium sp. G0240]